MPNGFEAFAQNAMALGDKWREQRKERRLSEALAKFDQDPQAAVQGVTRVDPVVGWNMRRQLQTDAAASEEATRARTTETLKTVTGLLGPAAMDPAATPESLSAAYDSIMPLLTDGLGMKPDEIVKWKQMFMQNPGILKQLDNELRVVAPGSAVLQGGQEVYRNPYPDTVLQVARGDGGRDVIQVPRSYGGAQQSYPATGLPSPAFEQIPGGGGVSSTVAALMPALIAQESRGNPKAIGPQTKYGRALGSTQMLPETAREMAGKLGLPFRQELLTSDSPEAVQYQQQLGAAYLQEGLEKYGGDAVKALMYYHGGPDERLWGPKTRRYARETLARLQGGDQGGYGGFGGIPARSGATPGAFYSTPGKPTKGPGAGYSVLNAQEVQELGLNPNVRWQRSDKGEIKPIGGAAAAGKAAKADQIYQSITANTQRMENAAGALLKHPGLERRAGIMSYVPFAAARLEILRNSLMLLNRRLASPF
jgi:hypothetical protein